MKQLDTEAYVTVLRGLILDGQEVRLEVSGGSMLPFLAGGRDSVFLRQADTPLRSGDIVCYRRTNGQYILHRICAVRPEGLYLLGDAQTLREGPAAPEQIFARVTKVIRKGALLTPDAALWRLFSGPWRWLRPLRPLIFFLRRHLHR